MEAAVVSNLSKLRSPRSAPASRPYNFLRDVSRTIPQCSTCGLQQHCVTRGLESGAMHSFDGLVTTHVRLRKGETLFRAGEKFAALYAIRSGSCKTVITTEDGSEQVSGYHMPGDVVGTDGMGAAIHDCQAVALEDTELCTLPYGKVDEMASTDRHVQASLRRVLLSEISRERDLMLILGTMRAHQRLAAYLLDLSKRYRARGYSSSEFVLRMTREEIGSYLGLKLETVSRLFSRFQRDGLIQVNARLIKLLDPMALGQLVSNNR